MKEFEQGFLFLKPGLVVLGTSHYVLYDLKNNRIFDLSKEWGVVFKLLETGVRRVDIINRTGISENTVDEVLETLFKEKMLIVSKNKIYLERPIFKQDENPLATIYITDHIVSSLVWNGCIAVSPFVNYKNLSRLDLDMLDDIVGAIWQVGKTSRVIFRLLNDVNIRNVVNYIIRSQWKDLNFTVVTHHSLWRFSSHRTFSLTLTVDDIARLETNSVALVPFSAVKKEKMGSLLSRVAISLRAEEKKEFLQYVKHLEGRFKVSRNLYFSLSNPTYSCRYGKLTVGTDGVVYDCPNGNRIDEVQSRVDMINVLFRFLKEDKPRSWYRESDKLSNCMKCGYYPICKGCSLIRERGELSVYDEILETCPLL